MRFQDIFLVMGREPWGFPPRPLRLTDFNGMSTRLGVFYALVLANRTFILAYLGQFLQIIVDAVIY